MDIEAAVVSNGRVKVKRRGYTQWSNMLGFHDGSNAPVSISEQGGNFICTYSNGIVKEFDDQARVIRRFKV